MNIQHFKADTITTQALGSMAESLRIAREKLIDLRWQCEAGSYSTFQAAKLANHILSEIFLPVPVLTPSVKRSPQTLENK